MTLFHLIALLLTLTTALTYLNARFLKLPTAIGVMAAALSLALLLNVLGDDAARTLQAQVDFSDVVLNGVLGLLLFASALQIDQKVLRERVRSVLLLAVLSTVLSTLIVGVLVYYGLALIGTELPLAYALLFGALISPTDPVAVSGLLDGSGASESSKVVLMGESLFNDGVGITLFSVFLSLIAPQSDVTMGSPIGHFLLEFVREAGGGVLLGTVLGFAAAFIIGQAKDTLVTILTTLTVVTGGYALTLFIGTSGPVAMAVAGLIIGYLMTKHDLTSARLYWETTDNLVNAGLFMLIGLEFLVIPFSGAALLAALLAVAFVLSARLSSVWLALLPARLWTDVPTSAYRFLTWAGLRGGIAIALALSVPAGSERDLIVVMTYGVVIFSILVQGLSVKWGVPRKVT